MPFDFDSLRGIGVTPITLETVLKTTRPPSRNQGICVCGHPANAHTENVDPGRSKVHDEARDEGRHICVPSKVHCPCPEYRQVLLVANTRPFHYKTTGSESDHALAKGVKAAYLKRYRIDWEVIKCFSTTCQNYMRVDGVTLVPVAFDAFYNESNRPTDLNVLICDTCREKTRTMIAGKAENRRAVRNEAMQWSAR